MTDRDSRPAFDPDSDFDLDGRVFDMESSTSSSVDPDSPTRFRYHEDAGVIWGDYDRDTVDIGRFAGTRTGAALIGPFQ